MKQDLESGSSLRGIEGPDTAVLKAQHRLGQAETEAEALLPHPGGPFDAVGVLRFDPVEPLKD
jgi:hypothetical protein